MNTYNTKKELNAHWYSFLKIVIEDCNAKDVVVMLNDGFIQHFEEATVHKSLEYLTTDAPIFSIAGEDYYIEYKTILPNDKEYTLKDQKTLQIDFMVNHLNTTVPLIHFVFNNCNKDFPFILEKILLERS